jgi:hypothetical protein
MANKLETFNAIAPELFRPLTDAYAYQFVEKKTGYYANTEWSAKLIYLNEKKGLRVEITQAPFYTDYGFSFFIFKVATEESNILYHVEHHLQDDEGDYLRKAVEDLFESPLTLTLISGQAWANLKYIPFQFV